MSFASPDEALDAIAACLAPMTTRVHTGLLGSGQTLECCPEPLLRIESSSTRAKEGIITLHGLSRNRCKDLILDVEVTYLECFESFDGDTAKPAALAAATAQGRALMATWWEALKRLACCSTTNQQIRFSSQQDQPPEGGCAGWTIRIETDLTICDCTDV